MKTKRWGNGTKTLLLKSVKTKNIYPLRCYYEAINNKLRYFG